MDQFFANPLILQKIFKSVNFNQNLQFRLVSKTFNAEVLRSIRSSHRQILFQTIDQPGIDRDNLSIFINHNEIKRISSRTYFKFLINVAQVKVDRLEVEGEFDLCCDEILLSYAIFEVLLKDQTVRVLLGIEALGPYDRKHLLECREYGPMYRHLLGFIPYHRHFDKLIVHESILFKSARIGSDAEHREDCLASLTDFISPLISCDQLELVLYETEEPQWLLYYPREVIELICKMWKVKSVVIVINRFADNKKPCRLPNHWQRKPFLTRIDFLSEAYQRPLSAYQLDFVEIKLKSGIRKVESFFDVFLANASYLFPAKQYFVKNLDISLSYFPTFSIKIEKSIMISTIIRINTSIDKNSSIPESWEILKTHQKEMYRFWTEKPIFENFKSLERVGAVIRISDKLIVEVYVEANGLEKRKIEKNSFLSLFL